MENKKNLKKRNKKGFTLIELVVVIAILGILAAILIPVIGGFIARAQTAANQANAKNLYNSVAMALAVGDTVATSPTTSAAGAELPDEVKAMFGEVPATDTWSFVVTSGTIVSATYNGETYSRE